nr:FxSxx-COOH system tetratricopeptide repeat protein [Streptomyces sp. SID8375]
MRPSLFVGRAEELKSLDRMLTEPRGVVVQALHGLGGIGKSTLAAYWAANSQSVNPKWWITADSPENIGAGLAALAVALEPALAQFLPIDSLQRRAVQWLAAHKGWLVVLDNVGDPENVRALLSQAPTGSFLITSRRATGWHGIALPLRLDVLGSSEARELFQRVITQNDDRNTSGVDEVCAELGYLPLAVEQAAAFCFESATPPREYLEMLSMYPAAMFETAAESEGDRRTISRVWRITLDHLAETRLAGEILRILAWYASDKIPRRLLDGLASPPEVARAVGRLAAYNMVTLSDGMLSVHRLVQALSRTPDPTDPHRQPNDIDHARKQAAGQLRMALPSEWEDPQHWPAWGPLILHIQAYARNIAPMVGDEDTAQVFSTAGAYLLKQGEVAPVIELFRQALVADEAVFGETHPETLASRNNLAYAYASAGAPDQAISLLEGALKEMVEAVGEKHPVSLTLRHNLADAYHAIGDLERSISLHESALLDREEVQGEDHPDTLTSRHNLALSFLSAERVDDAIPLYERTLRDRERVIGCDHPDTLTSRNNLAGAYKVAGRIFDAIPLFERALTDRERVLGADHPETHNSRRNLAFAYIEAGEFNKAIGLVEGYLSEQISEVSPVESATLRLTVGAAHWALGNRKKALLAVERAKIDSERFLDAGHEITSTARSVLAAMKRARS